MNDFVTPIPMATDCKVCKNAYYYDFLLNGICGRCIADALEAAAQTARYTRDKQTVLEAMRKLGKVLEC